MNPSCQHHHASSYHPEDPNSIFNSNLRAKRAAAAAASVPSSSYDKNRPVLLLPEEEDKKVDRAKNSLHYAKNGTAPSQQPRHAKLATYNPEAPNSPFNANLRAKRAAAASAAKQETAASSLPTISLQRQEETGIRVAAPQPRPRAFVAATYNPEAPNSPFNSKLRAERRRAAPKEEQEASLPTVPGRAVRRSSSLASLMLPEQLSGSDETPRRRLSQSEHTARGRDRRIVKRTKSTEANEELLAAVMANLRPVPVNDRSGDDDDDDESSSSSSSSFARDSDDSGEEWGGGSAHREGHVGVPKQGQHGRRGGPSHRRRQKRSRSTEANEDLLKALLANLRHVEAARQGGDRKPRLKRSQSCEAMEELLATIIANLRRARRNPRPGRRPAVFEMPDLRRAKAIVRQLESAGWSRPDLKHVLEEMRADQEGEASSLGGSRPSDGDDDDDSRGQSRNDVLEDEKHSRKATVLGDAEDRENASYTIEDARLESEFYYAYARSAARCKTREARARRLFLWHSRLGCVTRDAMKRTVATLPTSMGITEEDVDLLRWNKSGTRIINMPQMEREMLTLRDLRYADNGMRVYGSDDDDISDDEDV